MTTTVLDNNDNHFLLPPIYKVYPDLGVINPWSTVKTQEDEENYYKSLLYGCKECDRIEPSLQFMLYHRCTKNGKSKYKQHQQETRDKRKKIEGIGKW
jgi:hypothetical protein